MHKTYNPKGIAPTGGPFSHAVAVPAGARWLYLSGQVGIAPDGSVAEDFEGQAQQVWRNTLAILADAGMGPEHIVKLVNYVTDEADLAKVRTMRERFIGAVKPASTLIVVTALATPAWKYEMETVAAKAE